MTGYTGTRDTSGPVDCPREPPGYYWGSATDECRAYRRRLRAYEDWKRQQRLMEATMPKSKDGGFLMRAPTPQ